MIFVVQMVKVVAHTPTQMEVHLTSVVIVEVVVVPTSTMTGMHIVTIVVKVDLRVATDNV